MKCSQYIVATVVAFLLLPFGRGGWSAPAANEAKRTPEELLSEVRVLVVAAKLQLDFDQISSLKEAAGRAAAAASKVEKANADSWDKVGEDIWTAIGSNLGGQATSQSTWDKIDREVQFNQKATEPLSAQLDAALDDGFKILSEDQKAAIATAGYEGEELGSALHVPKAQFEQMMQSVLSVRNLSRDDYVASRDALALSLAGQIAGTGPQADTLTQRLLAILDAVYALSVQDFEAAKDRIPQDTMDYLGIVAEEQGTPSPSGGLDEEDFTDFLSDPNSAGVLEALLQGSREAASSQPPAGEKEQAAPSEQSAPKEGDASSASENAKPAEAEASTEESQTSKAWQWERALAGLDCFRLVVTLSLSPEQMQAMSLPLQTLFHGKMPEDRDRLLKDKAEELSKIAEGFWSAYLTQPAQDLIDRAEKLVTSLRTPSPDPQASQATLHQLKGLLTPEQAALIDWGDSSLLPQAIPGPDPNAIAQRNDILNYIHQRLLQARMMPARSRRGVLPPQYRATRWRATLADQVVRDLTLLRPVSPQEYPQLASAVRDAVFTALSMSPQEFDMNGYQLAGSLMERFGLGLPPPVPPPPPPPILESQFDRTMLDAASAQVLQLGSGSE